MDRFIKVGATAIMVGVLALVVVGVVNFLTMGHDPEHEPIGERTPTEAAQDGDEAVGGGPLESDGRDELRNEPAQNVRDGELPAEYLQQIQADEPFGDDPFEAAEPAEPGVDPFEAGEPSDDPFEAGEPPTEGEEAFDETLPPEGEEAFDETLPPADEEAFDETLPPADEEAFDDDVIQGESIDPFIPYYRYYLPGYRYREGEVYQDSEGRLRRQEPIFDRPRPEPAPEPDRPTLRDAPEPRGPGEEFVD